MDQRSTPDAPARNLFAGLAAVALLLGSCNTSGGTDELIDYVPEDGDAALELLMQGNVRFVEDRTVHDHETARRRMFLVDGQHPFAIVLGCADSRVVPELVFDQGLGDLFVIRVAGNVVADDEAGSIEYGIDHLHVPLVVVLGHEGCGAVTAALQAGGEETEELTRLLSKLKPALAGIDPTLPQEERVRLGVEANVRHSVGRLLDIVQREGGPIRPGQRIVGAVYELATGRVRLLDD